MKTPVRLLVVQFTLAAATLGAMAAPAGAEEIVVVAPSAPPAVLGEAVPAPRDGYVWDRGHWRWEHGRYVWAPGHWQPVRVGYHWVPGHWAPRGAHWAWVPGHWA